MEIGVATRINLLLLTLASFIPQLHRLNELKTYDGISFIYTFLNLFVATEQLALGSHFLVTTTHRSLGDWLNFVQFLIVFLYHAVIVFIGFRLPPIQTALKTGMASIYAFHFFTSIVLVIAETNTPRDDFLFGVIFGYPHFVFISPMATILGVVSAFFQFSLMLSRRTLGALSLHGLAFQAVVFTLVGFAWIWRFGEVEPPFGSLLWWYRLLGWAVADNLVFALVQGILFWVAWRRRDEGEASGERMPLLEP